MANLSVYCPHCRQNLPVNVVPPPGAAVQCYRCGAGFMMPRPQPKPPFAAPNPGANIARPQPNQQPVQPVARPQPRSIPPQSQYVPPATNLPPANYSQPTYPQPNYAQPTYGQGTLPPAGNVHSAGNSANVGIWVAAAGGGALLLVLLLLVVVLATRGGVPTPVAGAPAAAPGGATANSVVSAPVAAPVAAPGSPSPSPTSSTPGSTPTSTAPSAIPTPTPPTAAPSPAAAAYAYNFQPQMRYGYSFRVISNSGGDANRPALPVGADPRGVSGNIQGFVYYTAKPLDPAKLKQILAEQSGEGSGTAFVVNTGGILVTCEHVVRGANKVEVVLNKQSYSARVLAVDAKHDLAILKVEVTGLTALPIGNSDNVRLAEEVRAVGFPLSDVLGTGVKVTRGTVAGFVEQGDDKKLQIDATINPGNSGGPLVNTKGEMIGVNSSGLFGESVQPVGFAVISNDVRNFLQRNGLSGNAPPAGGPLEGPDLAQKVVPGVAFVKVTLGADPANCCMLDFAGHYSMGVGMQNHQGQVLASRQGETHSVDGDGSLPFLVGNFSNLAMERLPRAGETTWDLRNVSFLTMSSPGDSNPFGSSLPGRMRGRSRAPAPSRKVSLVPVLERVTWKLGPRTGDIQVFEKHHEFASPEKDPAVRLVDVAGNGTVSFDVRKGLIQSIRMTYNFKAIRNGATLQLPITFECDLNAVETPQQQADAIAKAKAKTAAAMPAVATGATPGPAATANDAEKVRSLLNELKKADPVNSFDAISPLLQLGIMRAIPDLREQVSQAVDPFLASKNDGVRMNAISAVKVWFTPKNEANLLKLLDDSNLAFRNQVIDCLGEYSRSAAAAQRLAKMLTGSRDRFVASLALGKMGSAAEDAVLPLLAKEDEDIRTTVCDILGKVGGAKSLPALEKLAANKASRNVRSRAEFALRAVKKRAGK